MSVQPVTSANSQAINQQQMELHLRTSTGLSTASSITSATGATTAAPAASTGFCASISAWISGAVESIVSCLAGLPLIGWMFGSVPATSTQPVSSTAIHPLALQDEVYVNILKTIYKPAPVAATSGATAVSAPAVPPVDIRNFAKDQFNAIQTPAAKWEALAVVLSACNSTDATATPPVNVGFEYYNAMTPAMQDQFKGEMYRVNGGSVFPPPPAAGGHDHRQGFGQYMVYHQINHATAIQAARNLQATPVTTP